MNLYILVASIDSWDSNYDKILSIHDNIESAQKAKQLIENEAEEIKNSLFIEDNEQHELYYLKKEINKLFVVSIVERELNSTITLAESIYL